MALVWSQSRWQRQQHAGLWWHLWKWSGTIIIVYDLLQFMITTWKCFYPNWQPASDKWKKRAKLGAEVCLKAPNPDLPSSSFLLHIPQFNFVFISTEQNLPVCRVEFHLMKEEFWLHSQRPATKRFLLRRRLGPSNVNLRSDGSGKTNSADSFKDYDKKGGIPQGRQMGVFIVQMWQLMIDSALTHWEWKHI